MHDGDTKRKISEGSVLSIKGNMAQLTSSCSKLPSIPKMKWGIFATQQRDGCRKYYQTKGKILNHFQSQPYFLCVTFKKSIAASKASFFSAFRIPKGTKRLLVGNDNLADTPRICPYTQASHGIRFRKPWPLRHEKKLYRPNLF